MKLILVTATVALTIAANNASDGSATVAAALQDDWAAQMQNAYDLREAACRDRITQTRAERGLPNLERKPASPEEPLFYAAVDHQLDGCGVLVMRHDLRDVRPVPLVPRNQPLFQPAR